MQFNGAKNVPRALVDPNYKAPKPRSAPVKDRFQERTFCSLLLTEDDTIFTSSRFCPTVVDEIEDRNQFLQDMKRLGQLTADIESNVKFEIAKMIQEMERIDCKERKRTHGNV